MQIADETKVRLAKVRNLCHACNEHIEAGSRIWPLAKRNLEKMNGGKIAQTRSISNNIVYSKAFFTWVHLNCAKVFLGEGTLSPPLCPYFAKHNTCGFGSACFYSHDIQPVNKSDSHVAHTIQIASEAKEEERDNANVHGNSKGCKSGHVRRFLIDKYGVDFLNAGSGVVDVAGGKGELAFELINLNGVAATVIDPRHVDCTRCVKKLRHGIYTRNPLYSKYITMKPLDVATFPKHVKIFFDRGMIEWFRTYDRSKQIEDVGAVKLRECTEYFQKGLEFANNKILVGESSKFQEYKRGVSKEQMRLKPLSSMDPATLDSDSTLPHPHQIHSDSEAYYILRHSSLLVGLHPDQATEYIIDFALENRKKFAVIPCCVCSKDFQNRVDKETGNAIKKYEAFIQYLCKKDSTIKQCQIGGLSGRNIVLYN